jgi:hypothetical protein
MKKIFIPGATLIALASCSLQKQTTNTAKTLGIYGAGVIQKPVLTNLKVNPKKITSFYSGSGTQGLDYHKSQAIAKVMAENKADVIIEPAYEIVTSTSSVRITTTGYAGTYENFRQMQGADTSLLVDVGIINYNNSRDQAPPHVAPKKKGTGAALLLLALLGAGVAAGTSGVF